MKGVYDTTVMINNPLNNMKIGGIVGYYRSGHFDHVYYNEVNLVPIGNTTEYIGEIFGMQETGYNNAAFAKELIKLKNSGDNIISNGALWYLGDLPYPQLYWEKNIELIKK